MALNSGPGTSESGPPSTAASGKPRPPSMTSRPRTRTAIDTNVSQRPWKTVDAPPARSKMQAPTLSCSAMLFASQRTDSNELQQVTDSLQHIVHTLTAILPIVERLASSGQDGGR